MRPNAVGCVTPPGPPQRDFTQPFYSDSLETYKTYFSVIMMMRQLRHHHHRVRRQRDPQPNAPQLRHCFWAAPPGASSPCTSRRGAERGPACPRTASRSRPSSGWPASATRRTPCGRRRAPSIPPSSWSRERRGPPPSWITSATTSGRGTLTEI